MIANLEENSSPRSMGERFQKYKYLILTIVFSFSGLALLRYGTTVEMTVLGIMLLLVGGILSFSIYEREVSAMEISTFCKKYPGAADNLHKITHASGRPITQRDLWHFADVFTQQISEAAESARRRQKISDQMKCL